MAITFDPVKRNRTFTERGLRFEDAAIIFEGPVFTFQDIRSDYGEARFVTVGYLEGRMIIVGWTPRGPNRHVFSMRKTNDREQALYRPLIR